MAPAPATTVAGKSVKKPAAKASSSAKANKAAAPRKASAHPPYFEMIKEALMALKERTGSSQYAIAKFIEEKQKGHLPSNFKKLLLVQLKKLVASGKLTKLKNSYKLSAIPKPSAAASAKPKTAALAKKVPAKEKTATKKSGGDVKEKKTTKAVAAKEKKAPAKVKKAPSKVKKVQAAVKKTPVKKPKSIKSPAKRLKK